MAGVHYIYSFGGIEIGDLEVVKLEKSIIAQSQTGG